MADKEKGDDKAKAPDLTDLTAASIRQQATTLYDCHSLNRFRTGAVLANYYGVHGLSAYAGSSLDPSLPSTRYRALDSMSTQSEIRAIVDTRLSQTVRVPDLRVSTSGAKWKKQRSARKIGQWIMGSLHRNGIGQGLWQVARDASTCPFGVSRLWFEDDGLHWERIRPDFVRYNPSEGKKPRNLWLVYGVPRAQLAETYPDQADYILHRAPKFKEEPLFPLINLVTDLEANLVEVIEHWRLGTRKKYGVHTVVCGDEILNPGTRTWKHLFFPVVEFVDNKSYDCFGGHSLGEQLLPDQAKLRAMDRTIDTAQARLSIGRTYLPKGSEIDKQQFSRTPGEFIEFAAIGGGKPIIAAGQACSPEYYQRRDRIASDMWEKAGVSKSQGTGTIPAGLAGASGKAQREYNNTAATRQKDFSEGLDDYFERICTRALAMAVEHFKAGGDGAKVLAVGSKVLDEIDFKQLDIVEGEGIEIKCVSVAGLPAHPAARMEYAKEGFDAGFWDKNYAIKLLAHPDIENAEDEATAAFDLAAWHIEKTLDDGRRFSPEPNRQYCEILLDLGTRELMQALRLECDEENIELLRRLLEAADQQLKQLPPAGGAPANDPQQLMPPGQVPQAANPLQAEAARWA